MATMSELVDFLAAVPERLRAATFGTPPGTRREAKLKAAWLEYIALHERALRPLVDHPALPEIMDTVGRIDRLWIRLSALAHSLELDNSAQGNLKRCERRWSERVQPLRDAIAEFGRFRDVVAAKPAPDSRQRRRLSEFADDFRELGERFKQFGIQAAKPTHLLINIEQTAVRAGRLLQEAADAGAFKDEKSWWRDGRTPMHAFLSSTESDHFRTLWRFSISSWLVKRFPSRFRHNASRCDFSQVAEDKEGRILGKDRKPLLARWYEDGKPLPGDWQGNPFDPEFWKTHDGDRYEWRLESEIAERSDFYDDSDALAHLRVRAEVYADACRLLAELVVKPATNWLTVTEAANALTKDLSGINLKKARARVSEAASRNQFQTNGRKGPARRVDPVSFDAWRLQQRERDLDQEG